MLPFKTVFWAVLQASAMLWLLMKLPNLTNEQLEQVKFLMLLHPLTNIEIQRYQNEPWFNGVF